MRETTERPEAVEAGTARLVGTDCGRIVAAARYLDGWAGSELGLPSVPEWAEPVWHLFVVRHPQRDALQ